LHRPFERIFDDFKRDDSSIYDRLIYAQSEIYNILSNSLKKARADSLINTIKNCYPDKWMVEEFTNDSQIEHCWKVEFHKNLGEFQILHQKHIDSQWMKLYDCFGTRKSVNEDMSEYIESCLDTMRKDIKDSTKKLEEEFKKVNPKFV